MRRLILFIVLVVSLVFIILYYSKNVRNESSMRFHTMGTDIIITVKDSGSREHIQAAFQTIEKISDLLDLNSSKSEISILNRLAGVSAVKVANETFAVLEQALKISKITGGAFDVTRKNYKCVILNPVSKTAFINNKGIDVDLGGIGKGYAVEQARNVLLRRGVKSALIDMRSSIAAIGGPWKIGIKHPRFKNQTIDVVELKDGEALSTSGNYEQGEHIVNSKNGKFVETCQSVTIIAKDAGFADGLSTGIFVIGVEQGLKLLKSLKDVRAVIVTLEGKVIKT